MAIDMFSLFYKFFLSIALGALIGVEREKRQQHHKGTDFAGIRTFMLVRCRHIYLPYTIVGFFL